MCQLAFHLLAGARNNLFLAHSSPTPHPLPLLPSSTTSEGEGKIGTYNKGQFYSTPVATCSRQQACVIVGAILVTLMACSLVIAFVKPNPDCEHHEDINTLDDPKPTPLPEAIATNGDPFPWNDIRLPDYVTPLRYSLVLHPNLTTLFLRGQMEVILSVNKETNFIIFHARNVTLTVVMVKDRNDREILTSRILYYPYHQQVSIELKNTLQPGSNYSLALRYEGRVREDLEGLYLSQYMTPDGVKRWL